MSRSVWMAGSATFTTEPSSVFMNIARQTTPSAIQRRRSAVAASLRRALGVIGPR